MILIEMSRSLHIEMEDTFLRPTRVGPFSISSMGKKFNDDAKKSSSQ